MMILHETLLDGLLEPVAAVCADKRARFRQTLHHLLDEEGRAPAALHDPRLQFLDGCVAPQLVIQQQLFQCNGQVVLVEKVMVSAK